MLIYLPSYVRSLHLVQTYVFERGSERLSMF